MISTFLFVAVIGVLLVSVQSSSPDCPPGSPICPDYCGGEDHTIPSLSPQAAAQWTLAQVQVIIRHGSRAPISFDGTCFLNDAPVTAAFNCSGMTDLLATSLVPPTPPSSPRQVANVSRLYRNVFMGGNYSKPQFSEELRGNCPSGILLPIGYTQEQRNGAALKAAYIGAGKLFATDALPNKEQMQLFSTANERCLASGRAVMDVLFTPPNPASNSQEVVDFLQTDSENDMFTGSSCARFGQMLDNSVFYLNPDECIDEQNLVNETAAQTNTLTTGPSNIWDCTLCYACNNLPLPSSIDSQMALLLTHQGSTLGSCQYNVPLTNQLAAGDLLQVMLRRMEATVGGGSLKFVLYSAHDITIMPVLAVMGALPTGPDSWPPYASMLSFELYSNNNNPQDFGIRMIYNGNVTAIAGCPGEICSFADFAPILMAKFTTPELCAVSTPSNHFVLTGEARDIVIGLGVAFVFTTIWAVIVSVLLCRARSRRGGRQEPLINFSG